MAARTLAELAKRTVIDAFFRHEPAPSLTEAVSDCSSSWEDNDDSMHEKPPLASSFTLSLTDIDDGGNCETPCSPLVVISNPLIGRGSTTVDDALGGNLSAPMPFGDPFCKADSKRSSFSGPRWTDEYAVKENDTLVSIAANFDLTPTMLKKINRLTVDYVYPGQILRVPPGLTKASSPRSSAAGSASSSALPNEPAAVAGTASSKSLLDDREQLPVSAAGAGNTSDRRDRCGSAAAAAAAPEPAAKRATADACQFVKLKAKYITEFDGTVSGTLLVTPNAIMFDPNVSDRFVIEYGAELYGVMVPMDMVMGAAIYDDAEAMSYEREHRENPMMPKPEVYHGEAVAENCVQNTIGKTASGSCGGDRLPLSASAAEAEPSGSHSSPSPPLGPKDRCPTSHGDTRRDKAQLTMTSDEKAQLTMTSLTDDLGPVCVLVSSNDDDQPVLPTRQQWAGKPPITAGPAGTGSCEGYQSDDVFFGLNEEIECDGNDLVRLNASSIPVVAASSLAQTVRPSSGSETALTDAELSENSERHGLPIPQALPRQHSGPWLSDISAAASAASFFTPPGLQIFVDYASGLFAVAGLKVESLQHGALTIDKSAVRLSEAAPDVDADHASAAAASSSFRFKSEACDKSDIFQVVDELLVRQTDDSLGSTRPLYLCLKVGVPMNKGPVHASHPIESYNRQQKPVYWFSIPSDKAAALYAFFIQWRADVYDTGDFDPAERGFVAISEDSPSVREETFSVGHPKHNRKLVRQLTKDWEIISISELKMRQSLLDAESNLPLPVMDTQSAIITEDHLRELVDALPLRLDGCPLHLAFGTEQHGFSLSKMFRNMQDIDSPILLLIQDTDEHVFGAFVSTSFNITEHFCGTGESFLFTFVGGFKVYSWTGENSLFCRGCMENLWIGSGEGTFGLYLDGDIYKGRTQHCKTYNNDPLTGGPEEFVVNRMEAWYFFD